MQRSTVDADRTGPVTVLIADDSDVFLAALAELFDSELGFTVVGTAATTEETINLACRLQPDVVMVDVQMPGGGAVEVAPALRSCSPRTVVVAITAGLSPTQGEPLRAAGACGPVEKGLRAEELLRLVTTWLDERRDGVRPPPAR